MRSLLFIILISLSIKGSSQSYTSYFTGNPVDLVRAPKGGVCLMGGASEHDEAMKWFLRQADGGDILILRASGSDGYNEYMYTELGVDLNSVETIVFNDASAANERYIHDKITQAEGIWFAGGDQWDYISYWRNTPIDRLINEAIHNRNMVIGGTSAGMAILGRYYFSAERGTVLSSTALSDPYGDLVTVDSTSFLRVNYLHDVITDTHYDAPDRKGRHMVFLARALTDYGIPARGIACNEYTSVCIDEQGLARVYGEYPDYPETAFFLQTNCELADFSPENCSPSTPLDWNREGTAIKVYKVNGTNDGANTFDLNDWKSGSGGSWEHWFVNNGSLTESTGTPIDCSIVSTDDDLSNARVSIYPNPVDDIFYIHSEHKILEMTLLDPHGRPLIRQSDFQNIEVSLASISLPSGIYFLKFRTKKGLLHYRLYKG